MASDEHRGDAPAAARAHEDPPARDAAGPAPRPSPAAPAPARRPGTHRRARIRRWLADGASLRDAVLLREILGPPRALRGRAGGGSGSGR